MNEQMIRDAQLQNARLECLKLAIVGHHTEHADVIIGRANKLMNFITNGTIEGKAA